MSVASGFAVYVVIWWTVLFAILPWGVRTDQEAGQDPVQGAATSAPHKPLLAKKALWTTLVSALLFALYLANWINGWIELKDLPGPFQSLQAKP